MIQSRICPSLGPIQNVYFLNKNVNCCSAYSLHASGSRKIFWTRIRIRRAAKKSPWPDVRSQVPRPPGGGGRAQTRPPRPAGAGTGAAARAGTAQAPALLPEVQQKRRRTLLLGSPKYSQLLFRCCWSEGRQPLRDCCGLSRHRCKFSMVRRVLLQLAGEKKRKEIINLFMLFKGTGSVQWKGRGFGKMVMVE